MEYSESTAATPRRWSCPLPCPIVGSDTFQPPARRKTKTLIRNRRPASAPTPAPSPPPPAEVTYSPLPTKPPPPLPSHPSPATTGTSNVRRQLNVDAVVCSVARTPRRSRQQHGPASDDITRSRRRWFPMSTGVSSTRPSRTILCSAQLCPASLDLLVAGLCLPPHRQGDDMTSFHGGARGATLRPHRL